MRDVIILFSACEPSCIFLTAKQKACTWLAILLPSKSVVCVDGSLGFRAVVNDGGRCGLCREYVRFFGEKISVGALPQPDVVLSLIQYSLIAINVMWRKTAERPLHT